MKELKKDSFILIRPFMVTKLNLKGNSLLIYALIHGITVNEGAFYGSIKYLQTWCNASNRNVIDCLKELVSSGLITKKKTGNTVLYKANILTECEESSQQCEESSLVGVKKVHSQSEESSHNILDINLNKKEFINSYPNNSDSEPFPEPDDFPKNANTPSKKTTCSKAPRKTEEQKHKEYLSTLTLYEGMKAADCVDLFIELHKKIDPLYNKDKARLKWQVDFAKFQKETQRPYEQILEVIKYAFNDEYRSPYLYTPENILNKFEDIVQKMSKTSLKTKYQQERDSALERGNMNTGNRDYTL